MFVRRLKQSLWFTEQFYQLHRSGISFAESLCLLRESCPDPIFAKVLGHILRSVKKGRSFSKSLEPHAEYFTEIYLALINVGEQSGNLTEVLQELHAYLRLQMNLRQSLIQALTYPCLILILMLGMLAFLLWFVIPQFEVIFASFKAPLPWLTTLLFMLIHHATTGLWILLLFLTWAVLCKKKLQRQWLFFKKKRSLLKWPGVGPYYHELLLMFLFKTVSLSLKSGLSLQQALNLLPRLFNATPFVALVVLLQQDLQAGHPLEKIFDHPEYFPPICLAYIKIANASGALDQQMQQLGRYFEGRVDRKTAQLKILLEPLILLVTGGMVGGVVIALYQPLFSLGGLM